MGAVGIRLGRFVYLVLILCLFWSCIVNYNLHIRFAEFRSAMVTDKADVLIGCGFLVTSTRTDHILWFKGSKGPRIICFDVPLRLNIIILGEFFELKSAAEAFN